MWNTAAEIIYNLLTSSCHRNDLHDLLGNEVTRYVHMRVFLLSPYVCPHVLGSWSRLHEFCSALYVLENLGSILSRCPNASVTRIHWRIGGGGPLQLPPSPTPFLELSLPSAINLVLSRLVFRNFSY